MLDIVLSKPSPLLGVALAMYVSSADAARFLSISIVAIEYCYFSVIAFAPELENPKSSSVLEKMMTITSASQRMTNSFSEFDPCSAHHYWISNLVGQFSHFIIWRKRIFYEGDEKNIFFERANPHFKKVLKSVYKRTFFLIRSNSRLQERIKFQVGLCYIL